MRDGPVKTVARKLAYTNKVWNVWLDHVRGDNGAEVLDYVVLAPHHPRLDRITGVAILPVQDGKYGLLRSFRHPVDRWVWEVPRGFIDAGEEPAVAALRELEEEAGLTCAAGDVLDLGLVMQEGSTLSAIAALFVAPRCTPQARSNEVELGLGDIHWFSSSEIFAMLDRSEVLDACTVTLLYRYAARGGLVVST